MKKICLCLALLGLVVLVGCNWSSKGGNYAAGKTFRLKGPASSTTLHAGESRLVEITIDRDKDFVAPVSLHAEPPAGAGLTCDFPNAVIKGNDTHVDMRVFAALDAQPGTHQVRVVGTPGEGNAVDLLVKVKVEGSPAEKHAK